MGIRKFFGFRSSKPIGWANRKSRFVTALSLGISNESTKMRRTIIYMALVIIILGPLFYGIKEELSVLDTVYFLVVMWTTVGYGDITPDAGPSRDFTIFYLCLSVLLIGAVMAISREYQSVVRKKSQWDKSQILAERMRGVRLEMEDKGSSTGGETDTQSASSAEAGAEVPPPAPDGAPSSAKRRKTARSSLTAVVGAVGKAKRRLSVMASSRSRLKRTKETLSALQTLNIDVYNEELEDIAWSMLCDLMVFVAVNLVGAGIISGLEDWRYDDALYWAVVTITTVGFGDFYPQTAGGKVFTILYAIFGVFYVSSALNELAQYPMMLLGKRNEIKIIDQFGKNMDEQQVESLINNDFFERVPSLKGDRPDARTQLTRAEFVLMVLNMMDKLQEKDAILLCALFDSLDSDSNGLITQSDVEVKVKAVRRHSQKMAEAAERGLPPPEYDDDDDDGSLSSSSFDEGPGISMRPLPARKQMFPSVDSGEGRDGRRDGHGAATGRRPTFMNPIEERDTETSNPMQSFSRSTVRAGSDSGSDAEDGVLTSSMVTQRRPTFTDPPSQPQSQPRPPPARPLSQLFAAADENDDEEDVPPPPPSY